MGTKPAETKNQKTVGWFHTHPNKNEEGYIADPSDNDQTFTRSVNVRIVKTHEGIKTISASGGGGSGREAIRPLSVHHHTTSSKRKDYL